MKDVEAELSGCKDCFGAKETAWQPLFGSLKAFQGTCQFTTMVADTAQSWRGRQGSGFGTKCWWLMTSQTTFQERIYRILESRNPALPLDLQTLLALQLQKPLAMFSTGKKNIWHLTCINQTGAPAHLASLELQRRCFWFVTHPKRHRSDNANASLCQLEAHATNTWAEWFISVEQACRTSKN